MCKLNEKNDLARKKLERYISENGVKLQFFAEKVNVPLSTLSKWKHGKKEFKEERLKEILEYIKSK